MPTPNLAETAPSSPDMGAQRHLYVGMDWNVARIGDPNHWVAKSDTTGSTYYVTEVEKGRWDARHGYPDLPGKPNSTIGFFASKMIAMTACERHDFNYWKSPLVRSGHEAVFVGSPDQVSDFVDALSPGERDDLLDVIAGNYALPDGSSFAAMASFFPTEKAGLKQERGGSFSFTLKVDPADLPLWLFHAKPGTSLSIGAAELGSSDSDDWKERCGRAIRRSFALPADVNFQSWLSRKYDVWGLIATALSRTSEDVEKAVTETLRRLVGVPSRRDFATNRDAVTKLERFDREYYLDMSRGFVEKVPDKFIE